MSETAVELDLLRRGFSTSRPTVPSRYDLVVEVSGRFYRVQTKTGRLDVRNNTLKASFDSPYSPDEVDVIAIYDPGADDVYYVRASDLAHGVTNVTIRFSPSSRESSGFMAEDVSDWPYQNEGGR